MGKRLGLLLFFCKRYLAEEKPLVVRVSTIEWGMNIVFFVVIAKVDA